MPTLEAVEAPETVASRVAAQAPARVVETTRLIRASRARIFEAWTNPALLRQWFGPATMACTLAETDPSVGGAYRIGVTPGVPGAAQAVATGHYTRIVPNQMLQFNWIPSWRQGERSLVTVKLEHVHGGTEVSIRHEHIAADAFNGYSEGWKGSLSKLAQLVERA